MFHIQPLSHTTFHCIMPISLVHLQVHISLATILEPLAVYLLHPHSDSRRSVHLMPITNLPIQSGLKPRCCSIIRAQGPALTGKDHSTRRTHSPSTKFFQEAGVILVTRSIPSEKILYLSRSFLITAKDLRTRTVVHARPARQLISLWESCSNELIVPMPESFLVARYRYARAEH